MGDWWKDTAVIIWWSIVCWLISLRLCSAKFPSETWNQQQEDYSHYQVRTDWFCLQCTTVSTETAQDPNQGCTNTTGKSNWVWHSDHEYIWYLVYIPFKLILFLMEYCCNFENNRFQPLCMGYLCSLVCKVDLWHEKYAQMTSSWRKQSINYTHVVGLLLGTDLDTHYI